MRAAAGCLDRKSLKRGVMSVMFGDCWEVSRMVASLSIILGLNGKLGITVQCGRRTVTSGF